MLPARKSLKNYKEMAGNQQKLQNATKSSGEASSGLKKLTPHFQPSFEQTRGFYRILKRLLQQPNSLQDGKWDTDSNFYYKLELVYGKENCKISIKYTQGQMCQEGVVATLDIYLHWREVEEASLSNLQKVQNELRLLGVQNEKINACFSLVKREFVKEPSRIVKNNCTLQIVCDEIVLLFVSGRGVNEITVFYDDEKNTPVYHRSVQEDGKQMT